MEKVVIIRYGEIGLKGKNRIFFEKKLVSNIKNTFKNSKVSRRRGRIILSYSNDDSNMIIEKMKRIFGIQNFSIGYFTNFDQKSIEEICCNLANYNFEKGNKTFRVNTNRANKTFPVRSMDFSALMGEKVLESNSNLSVDLHNPDFYIGIDIREKGTYIYTDKINGSAGLPVGVSGRGLLLLSGGIDSPVAGWYAMRRGINIDSIHFSSPPYTSQEALDKVLSLAKILTKYNGGKPMMFYNVNFTQAQVSIQRSVKPSVSLVIQRRFMMKVCNKVSEYFRYKTIISGESVGQVASQTLENIYSINDASDKLIIRPLITFDKIDTIEMSKKIGTYETSILPYEDCCTVFVPDSPATKTRVKSLKKEENLYDEEELLTSTINGIEVFKLLNGKIEGSDSFENIKENL